MKKLYLLLLFIVTLGVFGCSSVTSDIKVEVTRPHSFTEHGNGSFLKRLKYDRKAIFKFRLFRTENESTINANVFGYSLNSSLQGFYGSRPFNRYSGV